ncbi:MAG TPA: hypothetical protein VF458_05220 [Ktedonobacteraceae bacterium]
MKRIALIGAILGVLLVVDGIYMVASKYNDGETQAWNLPDGWIVVISAAVLLIASALAYVLSSRSAQSARSSQSVPEPVIKAELETEQA